MIIYFLFYLYGNEGSLYIKPHKLTSVGFLKMMSVSLRTLSYWFSVKFSVFLSWKKPTPIQIRCTAVSGTRGEESCGCGAVLGLT